MKISPKTIWTAATLRIALLLSLAVLGVSFVVDDGFEARAAGPDTEDLPSWSVVSVAGVIEDVENWGLLPRPEHIEGENVDLGEIRVLVVIQPGETQEEAVSRTFESLGARH